MVFFLGASYFANPLPKPSRGYQEVANETIQDFYFFQDDAQEILEGMFKKIHFKSFLRRNEVVVLHFWTPSCPSCVPEMKHLNSLAKEYTNKPIHFIALSLNDPLSGGLKNYFRVNQYTHLLPYHRASGTRPPIKGLPTTFFFTKQGKLIGRIKGPADWHSLSMKRFLNRLMTEESDKPLINQGALLFSPHTPLANRPLHKTPAMS